MLSSATTARATRERAGGPESGVIMDASLVQCRHLLSLSESIVADLEDSHRALEPRPDMKTAGWLVGHLAVNGDFAPVLCGRVALCPPAARSRPDRRQQVSGS